MNITIREVAERADVSTATVSRVMNGSDNVRRETRRRVLEAARALHYVPNEAARSLISSLTHTVGVLLPDMHGEFFAEVMRGIEQAAQQAEYHLLVSSSHSQEDEAGAMIRMMAGRVDGLVVMWPKAVSSLLALVPEGLPLVLLNASASEEQRYASIKIDNYGGAYEVVAHLVGHGHRRIATITGPAGNVDAQERRAGYRDALRDGGGAWQPELEVAGGFTQESGEQAAEQVLALSPRPAALFAANDAMAMGALRHFRRQGVRVPEDVAVAGFDDVPSAQYVPPGLTTVRVPMRDLGKRAMTCLLPTIGNGNAACTDVTVSTTLVVRASCGCSPGGDP